MKNSSRRLTLCLKLRPIQATRLGYPRELKIRFARLKPKWRVSHEEESKEERLTRRMRRRVCQRASAFFDSLISTIICSFFNCKNIFYYTLMWFIQISLGFKFPLTSTTFKWYFYFIFNYLQQLRGRSKGCSCSSKFDLWSLSLIKYWVQRVHPVFSV